MAQAKDNAGKEAKKAAKQARKQASKERRAQLWQAFQMQRKEDKRLIPYLVGIFVLVVAIAVGIGFLIHQIWMMIPIGIMLGLLAAFILFGRRVQKTVYAKADGQPGAAGWALDNMRGTWRVKQAINGTTHFDAVHQVIGKPGVMLVGEGNPNRVTPLLNQEKKKIARVVGNTPIYVIVVGNDEGQVELSKLDKYLNKLPNNINAKQVDALEARLAALSSRKGGAALPKGPLPQGAKVRNIQRTARRR
ncbi:DUF4191 domain-containing protein [Gordonia sp. X0973]|uniref:DUF4191 domain-containing protein n=1 Tax=Gordonia sp. X0973 TaxID=2742602 RepID=UPI000F533736|nr:DUF4191 domain-containing protein [Gordonia sp. X0973]QKT07633.1 DUF4191 domain-containing protein [Gordonia sp. X0973]